MQNNRPSINSMLKGGRKRKVDVILVGSDSGSSAGSDGNSDISRASVPRTPEVVTKRVRRVPRRYED
jgi:hypothetical protein